MHFSPRLALVFLLAIFIQPAMAQHGGASGAGAGGGAGAGAGAGGRTAGGGSIPGGTSSVTSIPQPGSTIPNIQSERRMIFISGSVVLKGGGPPPEPAAIERVCNGQARREGYTDSKGRYQIQLGQNFELQDVSETDNVSGMGGFDPGRGGAGGFGMPGGQGGVNPRDLMGCEIRAVLAGFHSTEVMLHPEDTFGELKVDTIVLQPLGGGGTGTTISLTTMQAPNNAKHAYEKAQKALQHEKLKDAEKELTKAVQEYPKFAAAWSLLGMVEQSFQRNDDAEKDYQQAIGADPQYANPYFGMAVLQAKKQNWQETVRLTDQVNRLAPLAFPDAYYFSGVANYELKTYDSAERDLRKYLSMDTEHRRPVASLVLGDILVRKHDYAGAAEQAKAYLTAAPNAPDAETVRARLKKLEDLSTQAQKQ